VTLPTFGASPLRLPRFCPAHLAYRLRPDLTCPLCAQEARQRGYAAQRAGYRARFPEAVQRALAARKAEVAD